MYRLIQKTDLIDTFVKKNIISKTTIRNIIFILKVFFYEITFRNEPKKCVHLVVPPPH